MINEEADAWKERYNSMCKQLESANNEISRLTGMTVQHEMQRTQIHNAKISNDGIVNDRVDTMNQEFQDAFTEVARLRAILRENGIDGD